MNARTVLIVSPYFPPSTLAGVHRARLLAKHLPLYGWEPIILCVDEAYHEQRLDRDLAALVPADREVIKVPALPIRLTRPLGLGEISLRAWLPLRRKLFEVLATRRVDAVLITGFPFYPMLLAPEIKRRFELPVVLDFQDPWVSAWGAKQKPWSKAGVSHKLAVLLEPKAVRAADFITSVSDTQNAEMVARYPWLDSAKMSAIPIGGDPEDFDYLRTVEPSDKVPHLSTEMINLCYVGSFWPAVEPSIRALFRGFARLRESDAELARLVRLGFFGTDATLSPIPKFAVRPLAEQEGVADAVYEAPQRLPYMEALAVLVNSHGLLLIGSGEPHYTASKIYPALMSGKPYLSLFHGESSAHAILSAAGGGVTFSFDGAEALANLTPALADGLKRLATDVGSVGRADPAAYADYEARAVARQYAEIFAQCRPGD